jgi:phosphoglycerate dehydrogenase-like enzyme
MSEVLYTTQPLSTTAQKFLEKHHVTVYTQNDDLTEAQRQSITIMYGWDDKVGQQLLATSHHLRWVQHIGAGVDNLPIQQLRDAGVIVSNASGIKSQPIAQTLLAYILGATRGLQYYANHHKWEPMTDQFLLSEVTVVIVGTGSIGQQLAEYLQPFGTTIYGVNTRGNALPHFDGVVASSQITTLLSSADIIVSTLPGTDETRSFFDATFFKQLRNVLLFANVGRGTTVEQTALLGALDERRLQYAALDVTQPEPLPSHHLLWQHPRVLLTQHTSWAEHTQPQRPETLFEVFQKNFAAYVAGEPLPHNQVDLTRGY